MKFQSKINQLTIALGFLVSALSLIPNTATAAEGPCKTCKTICANYNASLMDGDGNEKRDCQLDCKEECTIAPSHDQLPMKSLNCYERKECVANCSLTHADPTNPDQLTNCVQACAKEHQCLGASKLHGQPTRTAQPPTIPCVVISENAVECKGEAYVKASSNRGVLENRNFLENLKKFFAAPKQEVDEEKNGAEIRGY